MELGLEAAVLSVELGFNRSYLHDYFRKGTPKRMVNETKLKLADKLHLQPAAIGAVALAKPVATEGGLAEDAEPYYLDDMGRPPPHIARFVMKSTALMRHPQRIAPGTVLDFNINNIDPAGIKPGEIVLASLFDRHEMVKSHGTIIRQFLPPDKLVTNSTGHNEIIALDDPDKPYIAVIKGTLSHIIERAAA